MASEPAPAYQWYVKDWRSSRRVQLMSYQQRGMYREMLDEQWEEFSLPDNPRTVAELLGGPRAIWIKEWPVLRACFVVLANGRLQNRRLEKERVKQQKRREAGSRGGDNSGKSRRGELEAQTDFASSKPNDLLQVKSEDSRTLHLHLPVAVASSSACAVEPPVQPARGVRMIDSQPSALELRAGELLQHYGELYAKHQRGAKYHYRPNLDLAKALSLVQTWEDDARLEKLAILILTTDDEWIAGTDRGFAIFASKASWADVKLTEWEAAHGKVSA